MVAIHSSKICIHVFLICYSMKLSKISSFHFPPKKTNGITQQRQYNCVVDTAIGRDVRLKAQGMTPNNRSVSFTVIKSKVTSLSNSSTMGKDGLPAGGLSTRHRRS